jgi:hypothetical protein
MTLLIKNATSGKTALMKMQKILRGFGATSFGCMEDFERCEVIVQFQWRDHRVSIKASSRGYAAAWLKEHPWTPRARCTRPEHEAKVLKQGQLAVYVYLAGLAQRANHSG